MSTINAFFAKSRKARASISNKNNASKNIESPTHQHAVQAPQPIYESLPKPKTLITHTTSTTKNTNVANSILNYLSPLKQKQQKQNEYTPEQQQPRESVEINNIHEPTLPVQIRLNIPLSRVWVNVVEEFDPQSYINQLQRSPSPITPIEEKNVKEVTISSNIAVRTQTSNKRKKQRESFQQHNVRNVRIRPSETPVTLDMAYFESFLLQDTNENLSRPVRTKHSLQESNEIFSQIMNEIMILA